MCSYSSECYTFFGDRERKALNNVKLYRIFIYFYFIFFTVCIACGGACAVKMERD